MIRHKFGLRLSAAGALAAAGLLVLSGCAGGSEAQPDGESSDGGELETVRIAYTPGSATLHLRLAETLGYFEDNGIDVEVTEGLDLPTWSSALGRQYDLALATAGIFIDGAEKLDLTAVAGVQENTGSITSALIAKDPSYEDISDLEGKRIGVPTITGTTVLSLKYLMKEAGGDPDSMQFIQVPFGVGGDQLAAGQVDAIVSASPFYIPILENPENHVIYNDVMYEGMITIAPEQPTSANVFFVAKSAWAEENADLVEGFRAALKEAYDYIVENPEEAQNELVTWLQFDPEIAKQVDFTDIGMTTTVEPAQIQPLLDMQIDMGVLSEADAPDIAGRVLPMG